MGVQHDLRHDWKVKGNRYAFSQLLCSGVGRLPEDALLLTPSLTFKILEFVLNKWIFLTSFSPGGSFAEEHRHITLSDLGTCCRIKPQELASQTGDL